MSTASIGLPKSGISICAFLSAILAMAPVSAYPQQRATGKDGLAKDDGGMSRLMAISARIEQNQKLSDAERRFLSTGISRGKPAIAAAFVATATRATKYGAFSKARLLGLIEARAGLSSPADTPLFGRLYWYALIHPSQDKRKDVSLDSELRRILHSHKQPYGIDAEERSFIARDLRAGGTDAGYILISKSSLAERDKKWALGRCLAGLSQSRGALRTFWLFVRRVVDSRNRLAF